MPLFSPKSASYATPYGAIKVALDDKKAVATLQYFTKDFAGKPCGCVSTKTLQLRLNKIDKNFLEKLGKLEKIKKFQLINVWNLLKGDDGFFLYSESIEQYIKIKSTTDDLPLILDELIQAKILSCWPFFTECVFDQFIREQGSSCSIDILRTLPGMNQEKLSLFFNNSKAIKSLLNAGALLKQLSILSVSNLKNLFNLAGDLTNILKLVSIKQLLGISDNSPKICSLKSSPHLLQPTLAVGEGTVASNFSFRYTHDSLTINYAREYNYQCKFGSFAVEIPECILYHRKSLLHVWTISSWIINNTLSNFYKADDGPIIYEEYDCNFPINKFQESTSILQVVPYWNEFLTELKLERMNLSFQELHELPGMTPEKLSILIKDTSNLQKLLELLDIRKIINADAPRLELVLNNARYLHELTELIDIYQILDIPKEPEPLTPNNSINRGSAQTRGAYSVSFHKQPLAGQPGVNAEQWRSCLLM